MSAWSDDALFIGPAVVQRLQAEVPALREVLLIDDIEDRDAEPRQVPSAVVLLHALRPASVEPVQPRVPVEQLWMVVLAIRSARRDPARITSAVGPLIAACVAALHGWVPGAANRPIGWVPGPKPTYGGGTSYYPLVFRAQLTTS
ncbi:MAG: phage tail terminator protein [Burkholderiaceae bacterium]